MGKWIKKMKSVELEGVLRNSTVIKKGAWDIE